MKVDYNSSSRFSFLAVATGLVADIDINSERLRFLGGELRNLIYGVAYILRKRNYSMQLSDKERPKARYIVLVVAVCPMLDERVTFFPEMKSDPGVYLHQMDFTVTRGKLFKLWDLAKIILRDTQKCENNLEKTNVRQIWSSKKINSRQRYTWYSCFSVTD